MVFAASPEDGIFRSTDGGTSWAGNELKGRDIFSLVTNNEGDIFAGTLGSRLFKNTKGSSGWQQAPAGIICNYIFSLTHHGTSHYAGTECGVYRTTDEGGSWINISSGYSTGSTYSVAVNSRGDIFACSDSGIYRSTDGGVVWQESGLRNLNVFSLTVSNLNEIFAGTKRDGIFLSTDDGSTWTNIGLVRNDIQTIGVNISGYIFVGVYGGIYRSTDRGATWEKKTIDESYVYVLAFKGSQTVFAGTYNGVYASYNNGESWTKLSTAGLSETFILSLTFDPQDYLLAGTYRGGVYRSKQVITSIQLSSNMPTAVRLSQNYPNPFNPKTEIRFEVPVSGFVSLKIFNVLGEEVATLVNEKKSPGEYTITWDASNKPSGVYIYRLQLEKFVAVKKMLLIR